MRLSAERMHGQHDLCSLQFFSRSLGLVTSLTVAACFELYWNKNPTKAVRMGKVCGCLYLVITNSMDELNVNVEEHRFPLWALPFLSYRNEHRRRRRRRDHYHHHHANQRTRDGPQVTRRRDPSSTASMLIRLLAQMPLSPSPSRAFASCQYGAKIQSRPGYSTRKPQLLQNFPTACRDAPHSGQKAGRMACEVGAASTARDTCPSCRAGRGSHPASAAC